MPQDVRPIVALVTSDQADGIANLAYIADWPTGEVNDVDDTVGVIFLLPMFQVAEQSGVNTAWRLPLRRLDCPGWFAVQHAPINVDPSSVGRR
jgi:hypothetical protein